MSFWKLTQQSSAPPQPSKDSGKKTIRVFGQDDPANPGTVIIRSIDSDGNIGDYDGPQGEQGIQGDTGATGAPGTLATQDVENISNPTEIESLTLAGTGRDIIAHKVVGASGADLITRYAYDANGPAKNAPYVMNTGDGGTTRWVAVGANFFNNEPASAAGGRFITSAEIAQLASIPKPEMMFHGGVNDVGSDSIIGVHYGESGANEAIVMPFDGEIFAISVRAGTGRTAGILTASLLINNVIQNGAGEETTLDATNTNSNFQVIAAPIAFVAGDFLDIQSSTNSFAPTIADVVIAAFIRRT